MSTLVETIDAVHADIEKNVELPWHASHLYVPPAVLRPDIAPGRFLSIYPRNIMPELVVTPSSYEDWIYLHIVWSVQAFKNFEDNVVETEKVIAAYAANDLIVTQIKEYGCGIPGIGETAVYEETVYEIPWDGNGMMHIRNTLKAESFS